jgi:uncharacterized protein (TIGR02001 family)
MTLRDLNATLCALALAAPCGALAEDDPSFFEETGLTLAFGASLVTEYMSQGFELSDGPAFQPYAELGFGGFYAGIWASNGSREFLGAKYEIDVYAGYRGGYGDLFYDVGYFYYFFEDETFANEYGELVVSGGFGILDTVFVTGSVGYAPEYFDQVDVSLTGDYYTPIPGVSITSTIGRVDTDFGVWTYFSAGGAYQVADNVSLGVAYHHADDGGRFLGVTDGIVVGTLSIDFSAP